MRVSSGRNERGQLAAQIAEAVGGMHAGYFSIVRLTNGGRAASVTNTATLVDLPASDREGYGRIAVHREE